MIEIKYYTLSDEIGNIFYLGKTKNIKQRFYDHMYGSKNLNNKSYKDSKIRNIINNGGKILIEEIDSIFISSIKDDIKIVNNTEDYWISQLLAWGYKLTNFILNNNASYLSYINKTNNKKKRTIYLFDKKGNFIKSYLGINSLCNDKNLSAGTISNILNKKKYKSTHGFIVSYNKTINIDEKIDDFLLMKFKVKENEKESIYTGDYLINNLNIKKGCILRVISGERKTVNGLGIESIDYRYLRKTINRNKKVLAKNENDELIFTSLTEASKFFNVSKQEILNCISNKVKKSCGYIFSYIL